MSGINTNRTTIALPTEVSDEIIQKMQDGSAVMKLSRKIPLPGLGLTIPVITSDPEAGWVDETDPKPVSNPGLQKKTMQAYKLAVIAPFSNEFRRDMSALYDQLVARLPLALALKFDKTVIGAVNKPGENFDNFANCTVQSLIADGKTAYDGLVAAFTDIAGHNGAMDGIALSPVGEGVLLASVDGSKRPLFANSVADGMMNRILGSKTEISRGIYKSGVAPVGTGAGTPAIVGVAGDWTQALWGTVEGVKIDLSDQATITIDSTPVNLWERNMFAVRAEIEVGFRADTDCFNLLAGATPQS